MTTKKIKKEEKTTISENLLIEQIKEKVELHNNMINNKNELIASLKELETNITRNLGGIDNLQNLKTKYFADKSISVNKVV